MHKTLSPLHAALLLLVTFIWGSRCVVAGGVALANEPGKPVPAAKETT